MGILCTQAVVLKTQNLGETDRIAVLYSKAQGRLSGVAKGARRTKSRFTGTLELLNWIEAILFVKEGNQLAAIDKVDLIQSFSARTGNLRCLMQLSFLAELLLTTTAEREPNDSLFRLITLVLPLSTQPATSDMAQLYFEVWYLKLSGLFPLYRACHHCGNSLGEGATFVEPEMRRFSCQGCRDLRSMAFSRESWELLDGICRSHLASLSQRVPPNSALRELGGLVEGWLQSSFERSFQSLKLIRQAG